MKKLIACLLIIVLSHCFADAQLTKGNWMVGGAAGLTTANFFRASGDTGRSTTISIAPSIGYFITMRFAAGLRFSLSNYHYTEHQYLTGNPGVGNDFDIALDPFARYYFLKNTERPLNVFAEGSVGYGFKREIGSDLHHILNRYSLSAGTAFYFNNSIGLEFILGYYRSTQFGETTNGFQTRIGFQIHLEKEKKY